MSEFEPVLLTFAPGLTTPLALEVLPHGLTIHKFLVQNCGRTHDIVIGPESPKDHITQKYTNSIVGRYTNRIPVGTHILDRKGFQSEFKPMQNESSQVSLHGGPEGFDARPWTKISTTSRPELFTTAEISDISNLPETSYAFFRLESPSGDQGFPGALVTEVVVALTGPMDGQPADKAHEHTLGSVVIVYRARLKDGNTVTPVNLTQHWGFNLDASLQESPDSPTVKSHDLTIKANHIAELDSQGLATGQFLDVSQTPSHLHSEKRIGHQFPDKGYDDYYLFEDKMISSTPTRVPIANFSPDVNLLKGLILLASDEAHGSDKKGLVELSSERSGIKLVFDSNQRGVMLYSNAGAGPANGARKKIHGGSGISGDGDAYGPHTAAFLEFHHPLSAFLRPENKDKEDTLLTSEEIYHNYVRCRVRVKQPNQTA